MALKKMFDLQNGNAYDATLAPVAFASFSYYGLQGILFNWNK